MRLYRNPQTFQIAQANVWVKAFPADYSCVGSLIQNQEKVANIWICPYPPTISQQGVEFFPGATQYDDKLPWQDELWVMTDTPGATLSFTRVYDQDGVPQ